MPGLMDDGVVAPPEPEVEVQPEVQAEPEVHTENLQAKPEDTPPVDAPERPEWCPENFWKDGAADAEAMAKSYSELRKAFNEKNNDKIGDSVEDYMAEEYFTEQGNYKADGLVVPKDDPMLKAAFEAAKEAGLGIKATNEFVAKFMGKAGELAPPPIDVEAEVKSLGKNGPHIIQGLKTWIDGMESNGDITADVKAKLIALGSDAAGIKALDFLRSKTGEQGIPTGNAVTTGHLMTANDWYKATFETHAEPGESREQYDARMRAVGAKIFGTGHGSFNGSGLGIGGRR